MKKFFIASCVTCLCHIVLTQRDVRLPPTLTRWPRGKTLLYNNGSQFTLECGAKGTPSVRYGWKKNGFQLNTSLSNIRKESDGKITVNGPTERDEGYYQCFAKNQYGTTLSNTIHVQMIFIEPASGTPPVLEITVVKGMPFYIQSHQHRSFPKPLYDWYTAVDIDAQYPAKLRPSERIQFADDGDLHFAYALPDDERIYRCTTFYPDSPWESRRSHTRLTVTRNTTEDMRYFAPTLAFSSIVPPVALAGESMKLRCFFYGYPVPTISWIGPENALSTGRYSLEGFNTTLVLKEIKEYDEGDYSCTASNTQGDNTHTFQIRVAAAPKFQSTKDGPQNVNVTEGDSVIFSCNAFAKPEATVVWFQNGQPIDTDNAPERFVFSNDLKSLTIRDVCRDCVDRESKTDLMVIQCNASNAYGYDFASGYLNVLTKTTVMIKGSRNVPVDFLEEKQFVFLCDVISDPSRPAIVRWYKTEPFGDLVRDEPPYVYVTKNILVIMIDPKCSIDCTKYLGEYKCVGDDGYGQEHSTITLSYHYRSSTEELKKREDTWAAWKIILFAGAFGGALLIIGTFLGFRLNRRFGAMNRRSKGRKLPNPPSLYDRIDYESIDQVLEDMTRRESAMPGSHHLFESAKQNEVKGSGGPTCDDAGYLTPLEVIRSLGETDENQVNGHELVTSESGKSPKSHDKSESTNTNSYVSRKEVNLTLDSGKPDESRKKPNSYLALVSVEVNPYLDQSSTKVNSMASKEVHPNLKTNSKEMDDYLDMGSKKVNPYLNVGQKKMDSHPYLDTGPKATNLYMNKK